MTFTTKDIQHDKALISFLRNRVNHNGKTVIIGDYLYNVYNTAEVVTLIEDKIKKNKTGTNNTRFIPTWKKHLKAIKALSSTKHP